MSDEPPKKRRFWQFHLSTALLLSLAGGLMLKLNSYPGVDAIPLQEMEDCLLDLKRRYGSRTDVWMLYLEYGWPETCIVRSGHVSVDEQDQTRRTEATLLAAKWDTEPATTVHVFGIVIDGFVAALVCLGSGIACEWLIRRREGRQK
jgi:hypothetical protein